MARVYFKAFSPGATSREHSAAGRAVLERLIDDENVELSPSVPLKVHFGEEGNVTYVPAVTYDGIIDLLERRNVETCFVETNVLYRGERTFRPSHERLARRHGFTRLPVVIADGDHGDSYKEVEINKNHFKTCKIGYEIARQDQLIVAAHFKGHMLAGFGGAIKQLGMGCAARGGKLAQHINAVPLVNPLKCKRCYTCAQHCPEDAIKKGIMSAKIRTDRCIGCAA